MTSLNLGILAHVDAGKTTLTEELLHTAGVIDTVGRVDAGTTQTDSLALERQRGITIRAAVVAFTVGDVTVNLIDTPGHPDFIAEVDRSLRVLDGAVLVVSAVEGVQPQTVVLMRALRRLRVPTLIFVNKIDRAGADPDRVLQMMRDRLSAQFVPMGLPVEAGSRDAHFHPYEFDDDVFADRLLEALADHDDALLAAFVDGRRRSVPASALQSALAAQTAAVELYPVFFGSAITGAGVPALMAALPRLLPAAAGDIGAAVDGAVFKVDRGAGGQKLAYLRIFAGMLRVRDRVRIGSDREATVTAIRVFRHGGPVSSDAVSAGQIAIVSGLAEVRVGDNAGDGHRERVTGLFAPPPLETVVVPRDPSQKGALHAALAQLAESDPLIGLRQDDLRQELFVSLFGEVQKEVIEYTLESDFGIQIEFRDTTTICIERPVGRGTAVEHLGAPSNPFPATIGLELEPGPRGSGLEFRLEVDVHTVPLFIYKTLTAFASSMKDYIEDTLRQGLFGWQVHDCVVTMIDCGYVSPSTASGDFRKLTPLVIMEALSRAGTAVCEPIQHFQLDAPADTMSSVLRLLAQHRVVPAAPTLSGSWLSVAGDIPADEVYHLQQQLSGRTHGEGVLEVEFDRYEPVSGTPPRRPRSDNNPLNRKEYLLHVVRRV